MCISTNVPPVKVFDVPDLVGGIIW